MTTRSNGDPLVADEADEEGSAQQDSGEDDEDSTPEKSDPRTLFDNVKDNLPGQDEISVLRSSFQQATLVGLMSTLVVTLVAASILANMSLGVSRFSRKSNPNSNVLGLYYIKTPLSLQSKVEGTPSGPRIGEMGESYFLRYYVVPSEVISIPLEQQDNVALMDPNPNSKNHSEVVTRTVLMSSGRRLFITPRALTRELVETTKEDIVSPLVERWAGRIEALKRVLRPIHDEDTSMATTSSVQSIQGASPNTILAIYPEGAEQKDPFKNQPKAAKSQTLQAIRENTPRLPRVPKPAGKSVCPTSLFCYYTLPATIEKEGVACANYCGRCFESNSELKQAVHDYLNDSSHTSQVAKTYGWPIQNWCVSLLSDFSHVFANTHFNEDISRWDLSSATTLAHMFQGATLFDKPIEGWDASKVQDMSYFLAGATSFNQPLNGLDVSNVKTMKAMFANATKFSGDVSTWNTAKCRTMKGTFMGASSFNGELGLWQTGNVQDFSYMFHGATKFNSNINGWSVSKVTSTKAMFEGAKSFNQDMNWNTKRVRDMSFTFKDAVKFNGNITGWQVSQVTNIESMFQGTSSFGHNITSWRPRTGNRKNMFESATRFESLYKDEVYSAWAHRSNQNSLMFGEQDDSSLDTKKTLLEVWGIVRNSTNFTLSSQSS